MKARLFRITDVFLMLVVIFYALPAQAGKSSITVFDPPGSTSTSPSAINPAGEIAGSYNDATQTPRGFLRTADGAIATFAYPNCAAAQFAGATFINPAGVITGNCIEISPPTALCALPTAPSPQWTPRLDRHNCRWHRSGGRDHGGIR